MAKNILKFCLNSNDGNNQLYLEIMLEINRRKELLLGYLRYKHCPKTTNIIESFNSHLNDRLESLKGFKTYKTADLWINGYFLRRRTKKFTDCKGKFRYLNGQKSLEKTLKDDVDLPLFF
ncbi:MAG: hypothetical protein NT141_00050 [candidate division WWE3 bacterium]|nr:hypothetical protein [candidate division WWE3 bacterium]